VRLGVVVAVAAVALLGCSGLAPPRSSTAISGAATSATATSATATSGAATSGAATFARATSAAATSAATVTARVAEAEKTHEYVSGPSARQRADRSSASSVRAIEAFATAYINWRASTVAADMRALAAASVGQARSAMALAAATTAGDYELRRGGIANNGTVEAVAPLSGSHGEYVVVTREETSATNTAAYQGLRPAWHITLATVVAAGAGQWVVSGWQPES
jgi:hypothetical protein